MNRFSRYLLQWVLASLATLPLLGAHAALLSAKAQPPQQQLQANQDNNLALSWRVTSTPPGSTPPTGGVSSPSALVIDPSSGAVLANVGGPLSQGGGGPFILSEFIQLPAASVQEWQRRGLRRLLLVRDFADVSGSQRRGQQVLTLPSAELRAVTVQPAQRQLIANQDSPVMLSWQVTTRGDYNGTVSSRQATLVDPASGTVLGTLGGALRGEGRAPFMLNEQLDVPAASVQGWLASGIRRVILQREFSVDGASLRGQMVLSLVSSDLRAPRENQGGELLMQRLSLSFMDNRKITLVEPGSELKAKVLLAYSGNGLLEGRWQVAEPGSSEGQPFYRTLTLVRQFLGNSQQATLPSPPLPTDKAGKYRLRFCVGNGAQGPDDTLVLDYGCPNEALTVETVYQVLGGTGPEAQSLIGVSPQSGQVDASTPFEWRAVEAAVVYRVQFFATGPQGDSEAEVLGESPGFIAGMLLPASQTQATLSNLLRSKLEPGRHYLWRVTAHDENGELIGRSQEWRVRYQP